MISTLQYLGIYPEAIEKASETAEKALEFCDLSDKINDLHEMAAQYLEKKQWSFQKITDEIIYAYFSKAASIIERECHGSYDIDYYINCSDSHFYIGKEEV